VSWHTAGHRRQGVEVKPEEGKEPPRFADGSRIELAVQVAGVLAQALREVLAPRTW
jgi:hypothetical protein